jgi:hypothetical protein
MDSQLLELLDAAARVTGRDGDALRLVLLRLSRRREEDARARTTLEQLLSHPVDRGQQLAS